MAQGFEQTVLAHRLEAGVRGEDYIPTGVAGQHLSQHLFIAFIGRVMDLHSELSFEVGDGVRRNIG